MNSNPEWYTQTKDQCQIKIFSDLQDVREKSPPLQSFFRKLADVLYQKLCDALPTDVEYTQEPEPIIKEEFFTDLSKTNNWNLTEKGLCFSFNTYVLAPHAYGTISVVIPYSELTDILLPQYMPQ